MQDILQYTNTRFFYKQLVYKQQNSTRKIIMELLSMYRSKHKQLQKYSMKMKSTLSLQSRSQKQANQII